MHVLRHPLDDRHIQGIEILMAGDAGILLLSQRRPCPAEQDQKRQDAGHSLLKKPNHQGTKTQSPSPQNPKRSKFKVRKFKAESLNLEPALFFLVSLCLGGSFF
jgi:hypothetical protein